MSFPLEWHRKFLAFNLAAHGSDMRAFARIGPRRRMKPILDRGLHQCVIGRMKADKVDAPPVSIVGVELRRVLIRQRPELQKFGRPCAGPKRFKPAKRPCGAFALDRILQRRIGSKEVGVDEFDRLVEDLVGDGAVRVEGRAEIVLSIGKGAHGGKSFVA
jgi:hypothetical protein